MISRPYPSSLFSVTVLIGCFALAGCRPDDTVPPPQQELPAATGVQAPVPRTVTGCLRAGDAPQTFVLTASQVEDEAPVTATYQLVGHVDVDLAAHVGHTVEVSGTEIRPEEGSRIVQTPAQPAPGQRGAEEPEPGGQPAVATRTEVDIRELNVTSVRRVQEGCER
jgi:hypothetical protein